jgi:HEXXH motif-containing protein
VFLPGSSPPPEAIEQGMRTALAASLEHVHEVAAEAGDGCRADLKAALIEIRSHRVHPALFGCYYESVLALQARRHGDAIRLLGEIVELAPHRPAIAILRFTEQDLGSEMARYARLIDLAHQPLALLASPEPDQWRDFEDRVEAALARIDTADPRLGAELRALVLQIIGAAAPPNASRSFEGASSFMLWGAVFLNVARYPTSLDLVGGLVHEGAHHLLFGLSRDEPLTENVRADRFESPLRREPRPMEGVFHATFVCARVHYAYRRLRGAPAEADAASELERIRERLEDHERRFWSGYETLRRHARLTATGKRILSAAHAYMQGSS